MAIVVDFPHSNSTTGNCLLPIVLVCAIIKVLLLKLPLTLGVVLTVQGGWKTELGLVCMKGWTALVRPQRMCLSRDNMIESSSHSSFSLICISAQDHLGASAMLCSPNLWPPFTLRSQVTLRMGHLFGMLQCLYNSMILPLVPRGCHIMSSTVEGNLFPRFYKGAKCPDADNSVD